MLLDAYDPTFAHLHRGQLDKVNAMAGLLHLRSGRLEAAADHLRAVPQEAPSYAQARYLLGVLAAREDTAVAMRRFAQAERTEQTGGEDLALRAVLAQARIAFAQGEFDEAIALYARIPRFSELWYEALHEAGWAQLHQGRFGSALGAVHSLHAPYFKDRARAESFILQASAYFQLCRWDRAYTAIIRMMDRYEPISSALHRWLQTEHPLDRELEALTTGAGLPAEPWQQLERNRRLVRYRAQLQEARRELQKVNALSPGPFRAALLERLEEELRLRKRMVIELGRALLQKELRYLKDLLMQALIIRFELADVWRPLCNFPGNASLRAGPPAPLLQVKSPRYQTWRFGGEYWLDELGTYRVSIHNECIPEVFNW